jgi:hypothetical protein
MRLRLRLLLLLVAVLGLGGCQTMRGGGAPPPAFDIEDDMKALAAEFSTATSVSNYYTAIPENRVNSRNRFISGRLVQIDLQYIQFIRALTSDKQRLDTAADLANLSLGLAGTLVGGVRAKTNLAAAVTGLNGAKATVDKQYYYEKSMDALVGTMNARRKEVLVGILDGLATKNVDEYPFEVALTDLNEYYMAGTLNGALRFINAESATKEKQSDERIRARLTKTTEDIVDAIGRLTDALGGAAVTLDSAKSVWRALGEREELGDDLAAAKKQIQKKIRAINRLKTLDEKTAAVKKMTEAFKEAAWIT